MKSLARSWGVVLAVGKVTFLEIVRDRILFNIVVLAALLLGLGFLASKLSFLSPDRVILDFGFSAVGLSSAAIAVLVGAGMLGRELERRTFYVALSHPISRGQFLVGKFAGLAQVLLVQWVLVTGAYLLVMAIASFQGLAASWSATLGWGLVFLLMQSWVLGAVALFFSTFATTSLSVVLSIGIFFIGVNVGQIRLLAAKLESPIAAALLKGIATLVPNLEAFNFGLKITYGIPVQGEFVFWTGFYGLAVIAGLLLVSSMTVRGREI